MIIKFQEGDKWVVFGEIDHLEYEEITGKDQCDSRVICYQPRNSIEAANKHISLSFFSKNISEATIIQAYSPIYLMNDSGKTIEII